MYRDAAQAARNARRTTEGDFDFLRREMEQCDLVKDFIIVGSRHGATGSGYANQLFSEIGFKVGFGKSRTLRLSVVPAIGQQGLGFYGALNYIMSYGLQNPDQEDGIEL